MAEIVRGSSDDLVLAVQKALNAYEEQHPGATAQLYRQNPGSIRVRIIDDAFAGKPRTSRHNLVWNFLVAQLGKDNASELSLLLLLTHDELSSSMMNQEFESPLPSGL